VVGTHDPDDDYAIILEAVGHIERSHTTRSRLSLDGVTVLQGGLQAFRRVTVNH